MSKEKNNEEKIEQEEVQTEVVDGVDSPDEKNENAEDVVSSDEGDEYAEEVESVDSDDEDAISISSLQNDIDLWKDRYTRIMAEFDNYKKRSAKEYENMIKLASKNLMLDVVEVRDNFERAMDMVDEKHDLNSFVDGMKLVLSKLDDNLKKNGLEVFGEIGDEFNPEIHDALMQSESDEFEEGIISQIYEKGYKLRGVVIKHSKVIVSSGKKHVE